MTDQRLTHSQYLGRLYVTLAGLLAFVWVTTPSNADERTQPVAVSTSTSAAASTSTTSTVAPTTTVAMTTTTSGRLVLPFVQRCPDWLFITAIDVGWPYDQLETLQRVVIRESGPTCTNATAQNLSDPGSMGSVGLLQVNSGGWCDANQYWPVGWLQAQGIVSDCADLFDPVVNLEAGLAIWQRSGWAPWNL